MKKQYPVIVALDGMTLARSLAIARTLKGHVWGFKVHDLYLREGPAVLRRLKKFGKVFVDLKLYDIPQTVAHEVVALTALDVDLITIHAAGGRDMCESAVRAGGDRVAAVTVLTSLPRLAARRVPYFVSVARAAGVKSIVASAHEASALKKLYPTATIICPGIRSKGGDRHDQVRTATAREALARGADLLVIGRPITGSPQPLATLEALFP